MADHDLTPEQWRRLSELLDRLLDLDQGRRGAVLEEVSRDDPELGARVEALLAADARARGPLDASPGDLPGAILPRSPRGDEPSRVAGERRGPYRLVEEIARGGMGVVYLAERADGQFEQRVALKVLRRGLEADDILARFLQERQILARLEHPAIARLLDGGLSTSGEPYFALEYVAGEPITVYCDRLGLEVDARLRIFLKVCEGVQYAHRNLVIHRDLKPANILVDPSGQPKLLDFGIAKLLSEAETGRTAGNTRTGWSVMTPEYAAPEQLRGEPVTTATDVYALGLLLYELLTGVQPQRSAARSPLEAERWVLEKDPPRPSSTVAGSAPGADSGGGAGLVGRRGLSRRRLRRRLAGDVDTIVMCALRKAPERRYPSVEALAQDIERHLAGLPVKARGESLAYRSLKFVSRHRMGVGATALLFVVLSAGLVATFWQARARMLEARKARAVTDFLVSVFEVNDPDTARGEVVSARELLDRGAARIESELAPQSEVQAELMGVVGELYRRLGLYDQAEPLLRGALERERALHGGPHLDVAAAQHRWAVLLWDRGRYDEAEAAHRDALALRAALLGRDHPEVGQSLSGLAAVLTEKGAYEESESLYRRALAIDEASSGDDSPQVAADLESLAVVLWHKGEHDEAELLHRRALATRRRRLGNDHPDTVQSVHALASMLSTRGSYEEAEALFREAIASREKLLGSEHPSLALSLSNYAILLRRVGRLEEAKAVALRALEIDRRVLGPDHPDLATHLNNYGVLCYQLGDLPEAEDAFRQAMDIWQRQLGQRHPNVASCLNNIGMVRYEQGDPAGAEPMVREALALRRALLGPDHQGVSQSLRNLGLVLLELGRLGEAERALREGLEVARRAYPQGHLRTAEVLVGLGRVWVEGGRAEEAEPLLREALSIRAEKIGADDWRTAEAEIELGACLARGGRGVEAEELLRHGLETLQGRLGEDHRLTRRARALAVHHSPS